MSGNNNKSTKKPLPIAAIVAIAALAVLGIAWFAISAGRSSSSGPVRATFTVEPRDLTISVTESGEIKARRYTDYLCEVEGSTPIIDIVPEGTGITAEDVENGMVLCQLDDGDLSESYTKQKISFATAEAAYTEAVEANDIQVNQNESDITTARLAVKFALMDLKKYLSAELAEEIVQRTENLDSVDNRVIDSLIQELVADPCDPRWGGDSYQQKLLLESNIKLAKGQLERDKNQLRGTVRLFEKEYVAKTELERDQLSHDRSEIDVKQAQTALELFLRYDFPKETQQLFSDYIEAGRQLERTYAQARAMLAQTGAKLAQAKATYDLEKEQLEKLRQQVDACTITATVPGMVIYGSSTDYYSRRSDPIEIGDSVHKGQKIITIPDTNEMAAVIRVHESWVQKVDVGMPVTVVAEPFPDNRMSGEVLSVAPLPDPQSRWMNTGLKVYTTEVTIEGQHRHLRPGMSAKVEIIIDELDDVLAVPIQAVASNKGQKYCYVVKGDQLEQRPVKVGQFNDTFIHITEGLKAGDVISLVPPRQKEDEKKRDRSGERNGRKQQDDQDKQQEENAPNSDPDDPDNPQRGQDDDEAVPPGEEANARGPARGEGPPVQQ